MNFKNPVSTVDIIIEQAGGIILIERMNPPHGWALPGGFVDYGESLESAARREALEETGLVVNLLGQFHTYSDPDRDSRQHTISTVFVAQASGKAQAGSDARKAGLFTKSTLPEPIVFDHALILKDYFDWQANGRTGVGQLKP
ncbi:MAG: NUDIX hydrolase [Nitrospinae bacterium]|nr:NUDIX hydrolase [Nitrospinota bacterium]MBL7020323.1 NUDIX hydrolase [Nitrospinaceae bacterium]